MSVTFDEEKQKKRVEELYREEAEELAQMLSQKYSIPYVDLSRLSINTDALKVIPEAQARTMGIAGFDINGKKLSLVTIAPYHTGLTEFLEELARKQYLVTLYLGSHHSLERAWERYVEVSAAAKAESGLIDISESQLDYYATRIKHVDDVKTAIEEVLAGDRAHGASKIVELTLAGAIAVDSSDVHFEPQEETVRLRFRLDGVLHDVASIQNTLYKLILSRIKLISGLKLNLRAASQDGRFSIHMPITNTSSADQVEQVEIRTSVIPGAYGESIVMRVLNPKTISVPLEGLGIEEHLLALFDHEIQKPNGLILVTGPTGSGKTTTLYAFLRKVSNPGNKVITIEDPIEYHLKGLSQTQVSEQKGYTFLEGLRAALRQDPDIIMVGEIRDTETAKIAVNAALTGHLVFSTLHTNTAAGAIPRLIDLGVNAKVIGSALSTTIAQRLVRKLCAACRKEDVFTPEEREKIERVLGNIPSNAPFTIPPIGIAYRPVGCTACNNTGYKGRIGIYEAILMDSAIEAIVVANPSARDIQKAAHEQGALTMQEDGIVKVLRGVTDIAEIERVIDLEEV